MHLVSSYKSLQSINSAPTLQTFSKCFAYTRDAHAVIWIGLFRYVYMLSKIGGPASTQKYKSSDCICPCSNDLVRTLCRGVCNRQYCNTPYGHSAIYTQSAVLVDATYMAMVKYLYILMYLYTTRLSP